VARRGSLLLATLLLVAVCAGCVPLVQTTEDPTRAPAIEGDGFIADDGARLPLRIWHSSEPPQAVIVAVHGFNDYSKAWELPATWWAAHGVTTYAFDQRSFGETEARGIWPGRARMTQDLREVTALVGRRNPGKPLYLVGESMGAAVVMAAMAGPDPPRVAGIVLSAPAVWGRRNMNPFYRGSLWLAAHLMPWNRVTGEGLHIQASDNIEMLRALGRDPLVIKSTRIDAVYGLVNLMDAALAATPRITTPALVLYGVRDEVIPRRPVERMLEHWQGPHRVALYPDGWHMLFRDLEAPVVWGDVLAWMRDRAAPLPSGEERNGLPLFAKR